MATPGYYKTNYRATRFREVVRMRGLPWAFLSYVITRFKHADPGGWMPGLWADNQCRREDLSEAFWQATRRHQLDFEALGFTACGHVKSTGSLNPLLRDSGGITYLDPSRRLVGQLLYHRHFLQSTGQETGHVVIAFTADFEHGSLSCTNNNKAFDPPRGHEVIRLVSGDTKFVYRQFLQQLERHKETPRCFPDVESLRRWFDARQIEAFEERVRRRLFLPMTDEEVAAAKDRLLLPPAT